MCSKLSIRVQVLHLAAGGLSAGHLNQGLQPSKWRGFPYGPIRALNDSGKGA